MRIIFKSLEGIETGRLFDILLLMFFIALLTSIHCTASAAEESVAVVVDYVVDGDSLVVRRKGTAMEVRLWGIDAPEYDQPNSLPAKNALKKLVVGRKGELQAKYRDRYGRHVSLLTIEDLNINEAMVAAGHSWVYSRYCREVVCLRWAHLQAEAKKKKLGLWKENNPIAPWQWKASR
ncbi:MAG: thermonuclease family protein [Desulfocapsaceae bacterium]